MRFMGGDGGDHCSDEDDDASHHTGEDVGVGLRWAADGAGECSDDGVGDGSDAIVVGLHARATDTGRLYPYGYICRWWIHDLRYAILFRFVEGRVKTFAFSSRPKMTTGTSRTTGSSAGSAITIRRIFSTVRILHVSLFCVKPLHLIFCVS